MSNSGIRRNEYGKAADQTSPKRFVQRCRAEQGWGIFVDAAFEKEAGATLLGAEIYGGKLCQARCSERSKWGGLFVLSFYPFPQFREELLNRQVIGTRNIHSNLKHVRMENDIYLVQEECYLVKYSCRQGAELGKDILLFLYFFKNIFPKFLRSR